PPLRERADDVLPLAKYSLRRAAAAHRRETPAIARDAGAALRDYAWPGNVRELRHAIERAYDAARGATIAVGHLPSEILEAPALDNRVLSHRPTLDLGKRRYIAATNLHKPTNQTKSTRH